MGFWSGLIHLILPHRCLSCGCLIGQSPGLCQDCWEKLSFVTPPFCQVCGLSLPDTPLKEPMCGTCLAHPPPFSRARSVFWYNEASRRLVLSFKNKDKTLLATYMTPWLVQAGRPFWEGSPTLVPVPLHWKRQFIRQYNQSTLLAKAIGKHLALPVNCRLKRVKNSPSQGRFSLEKRKDNVRGAFLAEKEAFKGVERCILIDDVLTTGSTVEACTKALKKAGVQSVDVLTLCRVTKEDI